MSDANVCLTLIMSSTKVKTSRAARGSSAKTVVTSVKEICASFGGEKSLQAKLLSYKVTSKEKLEILENLMIHFLSQLKMMLKLTRKFKSLQPSEDSYRKPVLKLIYV